MKELECEYCGGVIQPKKVTVEHWYESKLVIIRDVPVGVCGECGERYYEAATLEQLDAIARQEDQLSPASTIPRPDGSGQSLVSRSGPVLVRVADN